MNDNWLIGGAFGFFGVMYFITMRKKLNDKVLALRKVREHFGLAIAKNVERIFRFETNHFKQGFEGNYSAGMHPTTEKFPYGWTSLKNFWLKYPRYAPKGVQQMK